MIYHLIKDEIPEYSTIQICKDATKHKIINTLRKLFKGNSFWKEIEKEGRVKVAPVKKHYVDKYVKSLRKGHEQAGYNLSYKDMIEYLLILDNDNKNKKE